MSERPHPAKFTMPILEVMGDSIDRFAPTQVGMKKGTPVEVVDIFCGTGKIHELQEYTLRFVHTRGIELEREWAASHPRTVHGDARDMWEYFTPGSVHVIATSPTYGNRMADHHEARDDSKRMTYRHQLGRPLSDGNTGMMQWGRQYQIFHQQIWALCWQGLPPGGLLILNIADHIRRGEIVRVSDWHVSEITNLGFEQAHHEWIDTRKMGFGANADLRVPGEHVYTFRKA